MLKEEYPEKLTMLVFIICLMASCGGFLFGYEVGFSGAMASNVMFQEMFFQIDTEVEAVDRLCKFNSLLLTSFTSSLYLFAFLASCFASTITRKYGIRFSVIAGALFFYIGDMINTFNGRNVVMLIIARALLGIGVGFSAHAVPLYVSEMAPTKYRGFLNSGYQLMITLGILVANYVNYGTSKIEGEWGWRWLLRLLLGVGLIVSPGLIFFLSFILPSTPSSLIECGDNEKARKILRRIRGTDDISTEYDNLVKASIRSEAPWSTLFEKKYRPQLVISFFIPAFQQLTGINVVMLYAHVLFEALRFESDSSLMSIGIIGSINVVATIVFIFVVDRAGRRFLFIEGGIGMFLGQVAVGTLIWMKVGTFGTAEIPKGYAIGVVFCICVFVAGFALSWGPLAWLVPVEISPLEIRSAVQSMNVAVNMLFTFIITLFSPLLLCKMKDDLFFVFIFATFVVSMTTFVFAFVPETKNVPIEEMQRVWKEHWFWSKYIDIDTDLKYRLGNLKV